MNRIIEAFTRPHYLTNAVDEIIIWGIVVLFLLLIVGLVGFLITRK